MKFLIVKTSALGDVIHTFPVISYLRKKFPDCTIDWVVENEGAAIVRAHPDIDRTLCVKTRQWRRGPFTAQNWKEVLAFRHDLHQRTYDCVFDLQGNVKSGLITFQARSKAKVGFGWQSLPEWPNFFSTNKRFNPTKGQNIREEYLSLVKQYFNDNDTAFEPSGIQLKIPKEHQELIDNILLQAHAPGRPKVMVCPGSAWPNKQMAEDALGDFLNKLQEAENCIYLFVWGSPAEKEFVTKLQQQLGSGLIVDRLTLPALQNLMFKVDKVVAMDSLPLHLAGTTNTPTFSVFGASSSKKYKPHGTQHRAFQGTCPYGRTFDKRCNILRTCKTGACIRGLSGSQVFEGLK